MVTCIKFLNKNPATSTAMSVTCAPLARMAVNASWPGVSIKVIFCPSNSTWRVFGKHREMCCCRDRLATHEAEDLFA